MQCDNIHPSPRDLFPSHSHQSTSFSGPFPTLISSSPSVCQSVPPPFPASLPPMLCLSSLPPSSFQAPCRQSQLLCVHDCISHFLP